MKLNKGFLALALVFVIVFSFAAVLQKQKEFDTAFQIGAQAVLSGKANPDSLSYSLLTFPVASNFGSISAERAPLPDNSTRAQMYSFVSANPGVQFRAICSGLGLSIGVVQFHLLCLQKAGFISAIRRGKYKRFFVAGKFTLRQMETIAALRLSTVKCILKALLEGKCVSHGELAAQVGISSQGLSWQMNRLRKSGLVKETRYCLSVTYSVEKKCVSHLTEVLSLLDSEVL